MIRILTLLAFCAITTGCVEVISDKEALDRLHQEETKEPIENAELMALKFSGIPVSVKTNDVTVPSYSDHPIFKAHTQRLKDKNLEYDPSQVFTTEAYEEAVAIQASYGKKTNNQVHHNDDSENEHSTGYYKPGAH